MGRVPFAAAVLVFACVEILHAQASGGADWWTFAGNAQRDGWEKGEQEFVKEDVRNFRLLWQVKLPNKRLGINALMTPVIAGNLAFVAGSDQNIWALAADRDHVVFSKHAEVVQAGKRKICGGSLTAAPVLLKPVLSGLNTLYFLTGDGLLRQLDSSGGSKDVPIPFVPAGSSAPALNAAEETIYAAARSGCGQEGSVWSVDTHESADSKARTFKLGVDVAGLGGVTLSPAGTVYVQTRDGVFDPTSGKWGGSVLALSKDLTLSNYFVMPGTEVKNSNTAMNVTSPLVINFKGDELVISVNRDGRLYVLRAPAIGGNSHHTYLYRSMVIATLDGDKTHGVWGGLSSWEDSDGTRYILAPVWGPPSAELQSAFPMAKVPNGFIVAFKLEQRRDVTTIVPAWISPDLDSPAPAIISKGVVFALSNGKFSANLTPVKQAHATLKALDAVTGEEIYSSKRQIAFDANLSGMSIADGRIYFATVDNTVYAFGK